MNVPTISKASIVSTSLSALEAGMHFSLWPAVNSAQVREQTGFRSQVHRAVGSQIQGLTQALGPGRKGPLASHLGNLLMLKFF
jgi:hypothetical protein